MSETFREWISNPGDLLRQMGGVVKRESVGQLIRTADYWRKRCGCLGCNALRNPIDIVDFDPSHAILWLVLVEEHLVIQLLKQRAQLFCFYELFVVECSLNRTNATTTCRRSLFPDPHAQQAL